MTRTQLPLFLALVAVVVVHSVSTAQVCGTEVVLKRLDAGTAGPELTTPDGAPVVGGPFSLRIEGAFPNSSGALVYSPVEAPFFDPTYGAIFHFGTPLKSVFFTTDGSGASPLQFPLVAVDPFLCGGFVVFQAGVFDPGAQNGVGVTNALRMVVGEHTGRIFEPELFTDRGGQDFALGDLDGDSLRDLATVIDDPFTADHVLSVRLGRVSGGFEETGSDTSFNVQGGGFPQTVARASVELADFTGEGDLDALVVSQEENGFHVFLGDGNGDFSGSVLSPAGLVPLQAAIEDFDLNGVLDVVVANSGDTMTSVHLGLGTGSFGTPTTFATGGAHDVVCGDLNDDGFTDVVGALRDTDRVSSMTGDGTGDFQLKGPFVVGFGPTHVVLGDFDGDTKLDVVTANLFSDDITLRPGNGNNFFSPVTTVIPTDGGTPRDLLATDLDGDSELDLAFVSDLNENVTLMYGNGDGTFELERVSRIPSPDAVNVTDFDLDGILDLMVVGAKDNSTLGGDDGYHVAFPGDGAGRFRGIKQFLIGLGVNDGEVIIADMNNDGLDDAVVRGGKEVHVLLGSRTGSISSSGRTADSEEHLVRDFDGDGFRDVVLVDDGSVSVLLNAGDGTLGVPITSASISDPRFVFAEDLDGDTATDLIVASFTAIEVFIGNGDGTFAPPASYTLNGGQIIGPTRFYAVDLNGDALVDLVFTLAGSLVVRLNAGDGTYGAEVAYPSVGRIDQFFTEDLGGSAEPDLVYAVDDVVKVRINVGDGTFVNEATYAAANADFSLLSGDLDGDQDIDLIGAQQVLLNHGDGTFFSGASIPVFLHHPIVLLDVNDDDDLDYVGMTVDPSEISVVLGNGDGTFAAPLNSATDDFWRFTPLLFEDFDGDAVLDVIFSVTGEEQLFMLPGSGDGTFGTEVPYYGSFAAEDLRSADFDGDGIRDLVQTNSGIASVLINQLGE